ncbi:MAG: LytTR family DNA-binding domain-containing protein [Acidobacteriota bacterium]|nr:LytTR family DNA-binding domain-containing protein [Acidobacteriota bacterium]
MKVLIVDDEQLARERVRRHLRDEPDVEIVGEAGNGREAVTAIEEKKPDLVFLDVQMPEMNGFEVLKALNESKIPAIVFTTAYDQYAIQAFEFHALDYLLKPFTRERFKRAVRHAREQFEILRQSGNLDERLVSLLENLKARKYLERIVVKTSGRVFFIKTDEIDWIEAAGNYLKLHVGRDAYLVRETMQSIETKLDPEKFFRIHRSTLVQIDRIKELHPLFGGDYAVILRNGTELSLSRNYRDRLPELFGNLS